MDIRTTSGEMTRTFSQELPIAMKAINGGPLSSQRKGHAIPCRVTQGSPRIHQEAEGTGRDFPSWNAGKSVRLISLWLSALLASLCAGDFLAGLYEGKMATNSLRLMSPQQKWNSFCPVIPTLKPVPGPHVSFLCCTPSTHILGSEYVSLMTGICRCCYSSQTFICKGFVRSHRPAICVQFRKNHPREERKRTQMLGRWSFAYRER